MSLFVEVLDVDKQCKIIVNMDEVEQIHPLRPGALKSIPTGGCYLVFSKSQLLVSNLYSEFLQFVVQPVSTERLQSQISKLNVQKEPFALPGQVESVPHPEKLVLTDKPKTPKSK